MMGTNGNGQSEREQALIRGMGRAFREKLEEVRNANPSRPLHIDLTPPVLPNMQYRVDVPAPEVTVTNQVAAPIVNVEAPNIDVAAPTVNVSIDMAPVAEALEKLADAEYQEAQRQERIVKALKLMGDQQQSILGQILAGQKAMTDALLGLAKAVSERPPIEVKPTIAVDMEPMAKAVRQLKRRPKTRSVKITHSDGTESTLTEE